MRLLTFILQIPIVLIAYIIISIPINIRAFWDYLKKDWEEWNKNNFD